MKKRVDLLGAITAHVIFISSIITFVSRMLFGLRPGHWIGIPLLLMAFPLIYLLIKAPAFKRPFLYYLQIGIMLLFIVILFLLDYVFKVDFRHVQWAVISFVMLYCAGLGGMIGVSSQAGKGWMISAVILFFIAVILAFVQRGVTGL